MDIVLKNVKKKDYPVLKSLSKSLGFEITEKAEQPYNKDFVKMILQGEQDILEGKGIKKTQQDLDALWK